MRTLRLRRGVLRYSQYPLRAYSMFDIVMVHLRTTTTPQNTPNIENISNRMQKQGKSASAVRVGTFAAVLIYCFAAAGRLRRASGLDTCYGERIYKYALTPFVIDKPPDLRRDQLRLGSPITVAICTGSIHAVRLDCGI